MKLKNVEASVYDKGGGELQVWGVSFTIPGTLYRDANGKIPDSARLRIAKQIKRILEQVEFPHEEASQKATEDHPNDD